MKHLFLACVNHVQLFTIPSVLNVMQLHVFFVLLGTFTIQLLLNAKSNQPQQKVVEMDSGTIFSRPVMTETSTTETDVTLSAKLNSITNVF